MEDWLSNSVNIANNGVDLKLTLANLKKADDGILKMVENLRKYKMERQGMSLFDYSFPS